jgi:hypothetical protein
MENLMGVLVAKAYPTALFANLADHTYVECRSGAKGWKCWGGKTGGRVIASGSGSTKRANEIARPDEKAGIKCYLVNGVCHQAANRILIEAKVTVRLARGYSISEALFGTYGRILAWPCASPFNTYPSVTGDLEACADGDSVPGASQEEVGALQASREAAYVEYVLAMYARAEKNGVSASADDHRNFQVDLFLQFAQYQLQERYDGVRGNLQEIKSGIEDRLTDLQSRFGENKIDARDYVAQFEQLTMDFQRLLGRALSASDYRALLTLHQDERVSLVDPQIVREVYGI